MTQYEDSGEIDVKKRIIEATIQVISRYAIYAVLGILFLGILWLKGTFQSEGFSLRGLLMALGCVFGLLQIIVFLGYGLVSIPKAICCQASVQERLDFALCKVDQCEDKVQSTRLQIEDLLTNCLSLKHHRVVTDSSDTQFLDTLIDKFPADQKESAQPYTVKEEIMKKYCDGSHKQLVAMN